MGLDIIWVIPPRTYSKPENIIIGGSGRYDNYSHWLCAVKKTLFSTFTTLSYYWFSKQLGQNLVAVLKAIRDENLKLKPTSEILGNIVSTHIQAKPMALKMFTWIVSMVYKIHAIFCRKFSGIWVYNNYFTIMFPSRSRIIESKYKKSWSIWQSWIPDFQQRC